MTATAAPATAYTVDTTGWELDHLAQMISQVRFDASQGNQRPLTANETEALEHDTLGLQLGLDDWWTTDTEVARALDTLEPVITEAIFQRDLAAALDRLNHGLDLTFEQRAAYDEYVAGL